MEDPWIPVQPRGTFHEALENKGERAKLERRKPMKFQISFQLSAENEGPCSLSTTKTRCGTTNGAHRIGFRVRRKPIHKVQFHSTNETTRTRPNCRWLPSKAALKSVDRSFWVVRRRWSPDWESNGTTFSQRSFRGSYWPRFGTFEQWRGCKIDGRI